MPGTGRALGPLGRRLLVAFIAVASISVAVVTVAALVGADRGIAEAEREMRQHMSRHSGEPGSILGFHATTGGRSVAWSWIIPAAVVAVLVAVGVSWYVSRRVTTPLVTFATAAHAFAEGDRSARVHVRPPGELGEVARAFDRMADDVVRAEVVRRSFAADVAHELRTPLTSLQAGLEELRDGLCEPDQARLAGLHDQALRLGRVVEDLAQLSAAESASLTLRLRDADLGEIVAAAVDAHEPELRSAGLQVRREIVAPVPVHGDADRLHQATVNLLTNAARYCRPGDRVDIRAFRAGANAVLEVADTGPGIPIDDQPHVFERMWRGHGQNTVAGSGIGLAVVRELVDAHGGTVSLESAPGDGATFTVTLPLASTRVGDGSVRPATDDRPESTHG